MSDYQRVGQNLVRHKRHRTYYAQFSRHGAKQRLSLRTTDRATADDRLRATLPRLRKLRRHAASLTFAELVHEWRAVVLDPRDLKPNSRAYREATINALFREWPALARLPVRQIHDRDCSAWAAHRQKTICAQRFNGELGTLKMILRYAVEESILLDNPAARLKRARVPKSQDFNAPTVAEFFAVLAHFRRWRRRRHALAMAQLLAYSGMRLEEATHLDWSEIDWARGLVHVTGGDVGTKNREDRWLPLFPDLKELLESLGPRKRGRVIVTGDCGKAIDGACAALKIKRFTHHDLRHFFATNAVESGANFKEVAAWLGHKDGGVLVASIYSHLRRDREQTAAANFSIRGLANRQEQGQLTTTPTPNHCRNLSKRACSSAVRAEDS